jgi:hypothetical protein
VKSSACASTTRSSRGRVPKSYCKSYRSGDDTGRIEIWNEKKNNITLNGSQYVDGFELRGHYGSAERMATLETRKGCDSALPITPPLMAKPNSYGP